MLLAPVQMHSLFGLGLGIVIAALVPQLRLVWLGLVIMVIAIVLDATRKTGAGFVS